MSGGGANPTNPAVASPIIPPPQFNLQWIQSNGFLTPYAFNFLQLLWASLQGTGGLVDQNNQNIPNPGQTISTVQALAEASAERAFPAPDQGGRISTLEDRITDLEIALARVGAAVALNQQPNQNPLPPLPQPSRISPSAVLWTPVIAGSTTPGAQTYASQWGLLIEIGPVVVAVFGVALSALDGATAGNVTITGLQTIADNATGTLSQPGFVSQWGNITLGAGRSDLAVKILPGVSAISVMESGSGLAILDLPVTALSATSQLSGAVIYFR